MSKISIIIPVYNTESYLRNCLDSLIAQTFTEYEVILVDDGSQDLSGIICDEYAQQDKRFKVIHKSNAGVSSARNEALDIATGDYIGFVDSDDTVLPEMLETYMTIAQNYEADIVQSTGPIGNIEVIEPSSVYMYDRNAAMNEFFKIGKVRPSLWLGIYKRTLFKDLKFPSNIHQWEDYALIAVLVSRCNKVVVTNQCFYHYIYREGSATKQPMNDRQMTCLLIDDYLGKYGVYRNFQDRHNVVSFFLRCCFLHYVLHTPERNRHYENIIVNGIRTSVSSILKSDSVTIKVKLMMFLFVVSEPLTRYLCCRYFYR